MEKGFIHYYRLVRPFLVLPTNDVSLLVPHEHILLSTKQLFQQILSPKILVSIFHHHLIFGVQS